MLIYLVLFHMENIIYVRSFITKINYFNSYKVIMK
nr:MAG TPA: hypothetical protein [Caudoviricetes sp.]